MKQINFLIAAMMAGLFAAGSAFADPPDFIPPGHQYGGGGGAGGAGGNGGNGYGGAGTGFTVNGLGNKVLSPSAEASARLDADIRNYNTLGQKQLQLQGQGQINGNAANKQSIQIDAPVIPTTTTLKNTPDVSLGGLYPSSPCMGTSNIGGSGPGFSLGFGTSWKDDDCGYRETARLFGVNTADGIAVLCSSEYAKAAPSCQKAAAKKAAAEAPVVAEQSDKRKVSGQKEAAPQVVASANPTECLTDEFMARRLGKAVCK